jgi:hypothetical protein
MISLYRGACVTVETADHRRLPFRAVTAVVDGHDFPVVWVCSEKEWAAANSEGREPQALPWPVEAVELRENAKNTR